MPPLQSVVRSPVSAAEPVEAVDAVGGTEP